MATTAPQFIMTPPRRKIMWALKDGNQPDNPKASDMKALEDRGFIKKDGGKYILTSDGVAAFEND